ncbi:MAG: extracellular solute-binding protein [Atopobiaceae bacterium]|jgi:iron(III) transport system substrate-binding protein
MANLSRRNFVKAAAVSAGLTLAAAGCSSQEQSSSQTESNSSDTSTQDSGLKSTSGKTLKVVCTSESYKELFDKFTEEVGAPVEFISMSSGEVLSKIKAEGDTPSADLWFGGGVDSFMSAKEAGLLAPVDFDAAKNFAKGFKDDDNYWFSKGLTIVGFIVNNDILGEIGAEKPQSWQDLTQSAYKDEIIMSTPAVSGTNYAAVNALLQNMGEENGWKFFEGLNENIPYYTKRGSDPSTRVAAGEAAIGITYIDKTLDDILADGTLELVYPEEGLPYMPDGVAAFEGADDLDDAKLFIEWLFSSNENMKYLTEIDKKTTILACIPTVEGITMDFEPDQLMKVDLALYGEQRDDILAKWAELTSDKEVVSSK